MSLSLGPPDLRPPEPRPPERRASMVFGWLRLNLSLSILCFSLLSGVVGAIISATIRVVNYDATFTAMQRNVQAIDTRLDAMQEATRKLQLEESDKSAETADRRARLASDLTGVETRLDAMQRSMNEMGPLQQRLIDSLAALDKRAAVLETQNKFFADYIHDNGLVGRKPK